MEIICPHCSVQIEIPEPIDHSMSSHCTMCHSRIPELTEILDKAWKREKRNDRIGSVIVFLVLLIGFIIWAQVSMTGREVYLYNDDYLEIIQASASKPPLDSTLPEYLGLSNVRIVCLSPDGSNHEANRYLPGRFRPESAEEVHAIAVINERQAGEKTYTAIGAGGDVKVKRYNWEIVVVEVTSGRRVDRHVVEGPSFPQQFRSGAGPDMRPRAKDVADYFRTLAPSETNSNKNTSKREDWILSESMNIRVYRVLMKNADLFRLHSSKQPTFEGNIGEATTSIVDAEFEKGILSFRPPLEAVKTDLPEGIGAPYLSVHISREQYEKNASARAEQYPRWLYKKQEAGSMENANGIIVCFEENTEKREEKNYRFYTIVSVDMRTVGPTLYGTEGDAKEFFRRLSFQREYKE